MQKEEHFMPKLNKQAYGNSHPFCFSSQLAVWLERPETVLPVIPIIMGEGSRVCVTLRTNSLLMSCQWFMRENCMLENTVMSVSSLVTYYFSAFKLYVLVG